MELVGRELRLARENLKLTQDVLAERIGKSKATISKIEAGKIGLDIDAFMTMAAELQLDPYVVLLKVQFEQSKGSPTESEVLGVLQRLLQAFNVRAIG